MTGSDAPDREVDRRGRVLLGLAAVAVGFAAADNYVVVLALPDMMGSAGLSAEDLQRAAPIISGFLLGYVAMLPLIGRIADVRGRLPVLVGSLVVFALGLLVTATAYDLTSVVAGRLLQGVGAGGLLPPTLALVADLYPPRRRGVPLGVVGAVQELGKVVGPVYGAVVLAFGSWRTIFWINLAVGLVLAAALRRRAAGTTLEPVEPRRVDVPGLVLAAAALGCLVLVMVQPPRLLADVTAGLAFLPVVGDSRWLSPLALACFALTLLLVLRCLTAREPLVDVRSWRATLAEVDLPGAFLLSVVLATIILAFATADPEVQVLSPAGPWLLVVGAVAAVLFWLRNRSVPHPLVPPRAVTATPAWGALVVSFFIGAAVIAALVDIPIFARITVHNDSQLMAALVLLRFLVGLPVGAFVGGWLTHRMGAGVVTALGMAVSAAGFGWMSQWQFEALESPVATVPLVAAGLGIGLAMAPVNAALLSVTAAGVHGLASALLIVARTVGKLVGISVLTTIGLRRYFAAQADLPEPMDVCGPGDSRCAEFSRILQDAGLVQLQTIFLGAAACCVAAGLVALVVFRHADTREVRTPPVGSGI
ncbi:MFS transporter [Nocardioides pinisoli]|uniref:MFS transporter n=1 Tax=Nocardioides pinisoli TaxID=2950279 RepID=A0ABT1L226_9ACTN|nr:MFS transporter [Nocardioides pinisoli]MCP3424084.1 MFS transporter [Nocardioides pinisoli]